MKRNTAKNPRHRPVSEAKRTAVLDAAREEFFAEGFAAARMERIARRSGVSKVTVYNRFGSKEALFVAMVQRECASMSAGLDRLTVELSDLKQQLIDFGESAMAFLMQSHVIRFERRIASESEHMPHIGELFLDAGPRRMQQKLIELIERAIVNRELKACDSRLAAGHLYGMLTGFDVFLSRFCNHALDKDDLHHRVVIAVDGFLAAYAAK